MPFQAAKSACLGRRRVRPAGRDRARAVPRPSQRPSPENAAPPRPGRGLAVTGCGRRAQRRVGALAIGATVTARIGSADRHGFGQGWAGPTAASGWAASAPGWCATAVRDSETVAWAAV